jgi:hypothetical protein
MPLKPLEFEEDPPKEPKGIDFARLNTPEAKEQARKNREALEAKYAAKAKAVKFQAEYLMKIIDDLNDWERGFIESVHGKAVTGVIPLSDKQEDVLEKIFNKY